MTLPPPPKRPLEQLYTIQPTTESLAEMKFNLVNYFELLIQLDVQRSEWLKQQADITKDEKVPKVPVDNSTESTDN